MYCVMVAGIGYWHQAIIKRNGSGQKAHFTSCILNIRDAPDVWRSDEAALAMK